VFGLYIYFINDISGVIGKKPVFIFAVLQRLLCQLTKCNVPDNTLDNFMTAGLK